MVEDSGGSGVTISEVTERGRDVTADLLACKMVFAQPLRLESPPAWIEHIPFAFAIMELHEPRLFVELGTHSGNSYCAFCQAVSRLGLPTRCYAVDTWEGDEHAGFYGDMVFKELSAYHDLRYGSFSNLLRMRFDDALEYFADGTVDLLHIDGNHHYEAVRHDFETWLPKLSSRGMVLFHDSFVRSNDFGVWRLVEEIRSSYRVFEFTHGHGLAVVAVGQDAVHSTLADLFREEDKATGAIRNCFSVLGKGLTHQYLAGIADSSMEELKAEIAKRDAEIAKRNAEIARMDVELAKKDADLKYANAQLLGVLDSYTWTLTEPIRWMVRHLRGLRHRWG